MKTIESLLQPFVGYLELGMYADANDELENLPTELKTHPTVLLARLELLAEMERWDDCALFGESLCGLWPDKHEFWIRTAYCQHELRLTQKAKDTLLLAPASIRDMSVFHYNMACYEAQLGNVDTAKEFLKTAIDKDGTFKEEALDDPDLEPLWASL